MKFRPLLAIVSLLTTLAACGQPAAPASARPQFEVASVKMVDSRPHPVEDLVKGIGVFAMSTYPTNRFFAHNSSLLMLVAIAYDFDEQNIQSDPKWSESQLYDVDASVPGEKQLSKEEMQPLLQTLLAERFHLSLHRATKPSSGFALVVAKSGSKLQAPDGKTSGTSAQILPNGFSARNVKLALIASILSRPAGAPVVDKTGLFGMFDVTLSYAPRNDPNSPLPDLFTAVQEQLGLKLVPQKVPVDYLVIDHVDRVPTEN